MPLLSHFHTLHTPPLSPEMRRVAFGLHSRKVMAWEWTVDEVDAQVGAEVASIAHEETVPFSHPMARIFEFGCHERRTALGAFFLEEDELLREIVPARPPSFSERRAAPVCWW